jgi:hypothetical protein
MKNRTATVALFVGLSLGLAGGYAFGTEPTKAVPIIGIDPVATDFVFMEIHVIDHDKTNNQKFFIGPLPHHGDAVEMIYTGDEESGAMKFQLRTKAP